ncbi:uncharacterized protein [Magallana gigas]|uniref:uncharacterized protein n=1 Tax=Magallana gigas TaxID=29159 RepID=UPI00333F51AD
MNSQDSLFSSSSSVKTEAFSSPSLTEQKQQVENFTWIQCDNVNCQKWRKIPANEGDHYDDVDWFCYMNSDPEYNSCDAVEEDYTAYDRLARKLGFKYVMSCLPVGSLVWAQSTGYCRWPALVTVDPQYHYHYEVDRDGDPYRYHVEYLGKNHCHAWIPAMRVTLYGHREDTCQDEQKNKPVKSTSRKWKKKKKLSLQTKSQRLEVYKRYTVTEAIREADLLIPLTVEERLEAACQFRESNFRQLRDLETKEENGRSSNMTRESECKCKKTQGAKRGRKRSSQSTADRKNDRGMKNSIERTVKCKTTSFIKREGKRRSEENHESRTKYSTKRSNLSVEERVPNSSSANQSMYEDTALTMTCSDTDEKNIDMFRFEDLEMNNSLLNRSQEERFAINVQQYKRNEQAFDHDLHRFMLRNGLRVQTKTTWHHTKVGLFQLFMAVFERGGYQKVCETMQWSSVYREITDSAAQGQCGHRAKVFYHKNVYPYELYIQGKNYQEIIKCLKVRGKKSGSPVKADPDLSSKKIKTDRVSEEHNSRDCLHTMLPEEKYVDLDHMLQELHQNSDKIFQLQDEIEGEQKRLGITIKFHEDSTPRVLSDGIVEANTPSEFMQASLPDKGCQFVPSVHFTSSESSQSCGFLHELRALENEFEDLDEEINMLIEENNCL